MGSLSGLQRGDGPTRSGARFATDGRSKRRDPWRGLCSVLAAVRVSNVPTARQWSIKKLAGCPRSTVRRLFSVISRV